MLFRTTLLLASALALAACCGDNDAACEQAQYNALTGIAGSYTATHTAPAPVFTSCTRNGNVVNCLSQ